jgi:hypothetical protein
VELDQFTVTASIACDLHAIAGKNEALEWGQFRSGSVTIAGTDYMPPKASSLPDLFDNLTREVSQIADIYEQAIHHGPNSVLLRCKQTYGQVFDEWLAVECWIPGNQSSCKAPA